jgi:hypothetical protein
MKNIPYILKVTIVTIGAAAIFYSIMLAISKNEESPEGQLMIEACQDIAAYETIRAESDIDSIISIIESHINESGEAPGNLYQGTLDELYALKDEVAFHNTQTDIYKNKFVEILNALCYAHLLEAIEMLKAGNEERAKLLVDHATHYLHDAMHFSEGELYENEYAVLKRLSMLRGDRFTISEIEYCGHELNKLI